MLQCSVKIPTTASQGTYAYSASKTNKESFIIDTWQVDRQ